MDERKMFEAWLKQPHQNNWNDSNHPLEVGERQAAWLAWQAARRTTPDREAIIEECAKVCDEQADFYERLNPKKGQGSYMGKLAVSRQRDCARLIRALKTAPTSDKGD
ncbi:hypothetical protein KDX05_06960 [Burkholderia vietnamiensis]|uniref:hypothetical protein n=1 Tax=Burkholderia vietnamiensis TaxID=60552 RepID=UPI001BA2EE21|nr:hypothetical protein [Burkholderia vietnamiensis]MBR8228050.1 hypothetical protein [Burkholderia vietnamiensis]